VTAERDQADAEARHAWEGTFDRPGEQAEAEHQLVLGGRTTLRDLVETVPEPDECGPGWADGERSRFGRLARRLWDPVLAHERSS
jgi:exodeoxyribonuclease V gamma subunit